MKALPRAIVSLLIAINAFLFLDILLRGKNIQILNPQGYIALQERNVMIEAILIMLIIIIPVFVFAFYVAVRFNEVSKKAKYMPDWDHNTKLQIFIWAFPTCIIICLSVLVWVSAHALDPHNIIAGDKNQLTVQVVATRWKWIFIYPTYGIATINYLEIPEKTPVFFELTASDTPMNSFWIPQLGGQIYAMSGMATETHLIADSTGTYRGSDAEINGAGFSDMDFTVESVSPNSFTSWAQNLRSVPKILSFKEVRRLSSPSMDVPPTFYSVTDQNLFNTIVMQYMAPSASSPTTSSQTTNSNTQSMQQMQGM